MLATAAALLVLVTAPPPTPPPTPAAESTVAAVVEELRAAELVLDADAMGRLIARSFTLVRGGARTAGRFAYLESVRRMRERKARVRDLTFGQRHVAVYGGSAVASYVIHKVWSDDGRTRTVDGWCTDVFELREDGIWLLVHRHRP